MGTFNWPMAVANMDRDKSRELQAAVDTGATYTALPSNLLRELGVTVARKASFELGDGRIIEMDVGRIWATINGVSDVTPVVFGEDDTQPLLGAVTMEQLLLAVDPVQQRLVPTNAIWY
jgi:predicted aspartyl protease